jgi:hypothetical protein
MGCGYDFVSGGDEFFATLAFREEFQEFLLSKASWPARLILTTGTRIMTVHPRFTVQRPSSDRLEKTSGAMAEAVRGATADSSKLLRLMRAALNAPRSSVWVMRAVFRLLSRMLTEPYLAEATLRRIQADPFVRLKIMRTVGMTPAQYAVLSALARWMENGYRRLRATGRRLRTYAPAEWLDVLQSHLAAQIDEMREHIDAMVLRPAFFIVIDARRSERNLDVTIGSLHAQFYRAARVAVLRRDGPDKGNSEIQLMPDASDETVQWIGHLDVCDPAFARLDYLLFIEPGDRLVPSALYSFASAINREPTNALVYADELFPTSSGVPLPFHKPAWSPDYLESFDYIGHSGVFSMARARQLSLPFTSVYDFTLRFTESLRDDRVVHLDNPLFERAASFERKVASDDDVAAIRGRLERTGRSGVIVPAPSGINCYHTRVRWERTPEISIVIPTAGYTKLIDGRDTDLIVNITQQIVERSTFRAAEIVVVDNGDLSERQQNHLAKLGCRRVTFEEQVFNIAKKLNLGASVAEGELLLLMNDDMEIVQEDWIERLCDHIAKPDVGVVGCKLLYPDRSTQHVGVVQSHGSPDHVRRGYPADDAGYFNSTCGVRNYLAVTGACMLTRKALYQRLGGYAPQLPADFNDIDFCLNVRAAGYRVVYTGDVTLIHMESLSRVPAGGPEGVRYYQDGTRYYRERWTPVLPVDPFYNERFLTLAPPSFEPRTNDRLL